MNHQAQNLVPQKHRMGGGGGGGAQLIMNMDDVPDPRYIPRAVTFDDRNLVRSAQYDDEEGDEEWDDEDGDDVDDDDVDDGDDNEEDADDGDDTAKESVVHDERPIGGSGGKKSFEELLEEQLKEEEEKLRLDSQQTSGERKLPFLRKGEGIARFNSAPKKPPPRPPKRTLAGSKSAAKPPWVSGDAGGSGGGGGGDSVKSQGVGGQNRTGNVSKKDSVGNRLKAMSNGRPMERKGVRNGPKNVAASNFQKTARSPEHPPRKLTLIRSAANKKLEQQKARQNAEMETDAKLQRLVEDAQGRVQTLQVGSEKSGSRSPSGASRRSSRTDDHDSTELDSLAEFELMEEAMDNVSFCSNSSLVRKLVSSDYHKEAIGRLKTINESKKGITGESAEDSARGQNSRPGKNEKNNEELTEHEKAGATIKTQSAFFKANSDHNNINNNSNINENTSNSGSNNKKTLSSNGGGRNIQVAEPDSDASSSDATLTDSSDDNDDEFYDDKVEENKKEGFHRQQHQGGILQQGDGYTSLQNGLTTMKDSAAAHLSPELEQNFASYADKVGSNSQQTNSPSKALPRKVAPLAGKFSSANDTLSMLKALSQQAGYLTSGGGGAGDGGQKFDKSKNNSASLVAQAMSNGTADNRDPQVPPNFASSGAPFAFSAPNGASVVPVTSFGFTGLTETSQALQPSSLYSTMVQPTFTSAPSHHLGPESQQAENPLRSSLNKLYSSQKYNYNNGKSSAVVVDKLRNAAGDSDNYESEEEGNSSDDESDEYNSEEEEKLEKKKWCGEDKGKISQRLVEETGSHSEGKKVSTGTAERSGTVHEGAPGRLGSRSVATATAAAFDDEVEWTDEDEDAQTCLKSSSEPAPVPMSEGTMLSTPPTSRLVTRLFPKLKTKPSAEAEKASAALQQASAAPLAQSAQQQQQQADGIQSRVLRDKLKELEVEIERFRSENANLDRLRREREEGLSKLKQEIETFQKEKEQELKRLEDFKQEEIKKLKRERKLFETYQKKVRSMPDKKEREEIENLRQQLEEVQEELKRKESRWNSSTARLKNRLAEVELENGELKEEIRILERKRLEWMTAQSNAKVAGQQVNGKVSLEGSTVKSGGGSRAAQAGSSFPRSSTPTHEQDEPAIKSAPAGSNVKAPSEKGNLGSTAAQRPLTSGSSSAGSKIPAPMSGLRNGHPVVTNRPQGAMSRPQGGGVSEQTVLTNGRNGGGAGGVAAAVTQSVLAPPTAHSGLSGDGMQTENGPVPVMMENTIPNGVPAASMPGTRSSAVLDQTSKSAAALAIERAVVDKGDSAAYSETQHGDGKLEKTYRNGAKEIRFPNGTVKEISADGQTIVCRLANGDIRQIFPDHRVVYIFAEAEIMQSTFPDGLETFHFKNGQTERRYPDGTVEITFPTKDVKYLFPDGGQEVILTDGTVMQYNSKGERTVEYPSGDREVHTAEYQRREFPDGIVKTVYSDGRHETRFPNGRVRMRDKAGNVIMDQIVYR
ncbi:centromere protein J [Aplysia californica]|uniref:Centromere protein J n=1 Tax=Aplysia californica TaxID=6500 RepID=A0ABM1W4V4_APLCA|nr:centromere protein J [Aplysia californica]